jgi:hypothetical protein
MKFRNQGLRYGPLRQIRWAFAADDGDGGGGGEGEGGDEGASASAEGDGEGSAMPDATPVWPEDWQAQMTGGDEKAQKHIGRYASPPEVYKALTAAQQKIRSGEVINPLPENPTEEDLKAYREARGIPEEPGKYDLNLGDGVVVGEEDQPLVDSFLKEAHDGNLDPATVNRVVKWWYNNREEQMDALGVLDEEKKAQCEDDLRNEWGQTPSSR